MSWHRQSVPQNSFVEQAVLLSEPTQYAYLWSGSSTDVYFRFGVDGELIDFRHADLNIGIEIERPGDNQGAGGIMGTGGSGGWEAGGAGGVPVAGGAAGGIAYGGAGGS